MSSPDTRKQIDDALELAHTTLQPTEREAVAEALVAARGSKPLHMAPLMPRGMNVAERLLDALDGIEEHEGRERRLDWERLVRANLEAPKSNPSPADMTEEELMRAIAQRDPDAAGALRETEGERGD